MLKSTNCTIGVGESNFSVIYKNDTRNASYIKQTSKMRCNLLFHIEFGNITLIYINLQQKLVVIKLCTGQN